MPRFLISVASWFIAKTLPASALADHYELVAHMKQNNLNEFERLFWDISTPDSGKYLQHLSVGEVAAIIGAEDDNIDAASMWLRDLGAVEGSIHVSPLRDSVTATFSRASHSLPLKLQAQSRPSSVDFVLRRDATEVPVEETEKLRQTSHSNDWSYNVNDVKNAYGIPTDLQVTNAETRQMVWGPGTFGFGTWELLSFKLSQCPLLDTSKIHFDTENQGTSGGDNFAEGNLDTHMIASFGLNAETIVSNTNTSTSTEEGEGFGQALLDFVTQLAAREEVPQVLSLSLGSLSGESCDLLCDKAVDAGHTRQECRDYLQQQRQVCMFLSQDQVSRINTAFQVLGARGVSVFASSGDGGSHFSFTEFSGGDIADTLNQISCEFQMPVFPTCSPYVISVGGEMWGIGGATDPITWAGYGGGSGGGFSWQFDQPAHQNATVAAYLAGGDLPPTSSFNTQGRAYPDISAVGVQGTSQSCPMVAGIFSLVNDHRLNSGLPPLGFLGPRIWQTARQQPGEVFQDISEGNSKTSCASGFPATQGWDPNTGFGRPIWSGLLQSFGSDAFAGASVVV